MRLTDCQIQAIRQLARQVGGSQSRVRVFGSRLDDAAHGGDLDLMLELPEPVDNPALMAAQMSALVSRAMHGRKVDVLLMFGGLFTLEQATRLEEDPDLAERVEAFVGRFGRLQDTVGDKLLPLLLATLGEKPSAAIDNLDRAERLGLLKSADEWMAMRNLRNQMVHEYVEDPVILSSALQTGHAFVPTLMVTANKMITEIERRGWA